MAPTIMRTMTAPRLPAVVARVVAWHNRHPLARRIDASQVHSIGEVRLPFASAKAWGDAPAPAPAPASLPETPPPAAAAGGDSHAPTLAEALAQRHARQVPTEAGGPAGIDGLAVATLQPDDEPAADPATPQDAADDAPPAAEAQADAGDDDGEAALVIPLLDGDAAAAAPPETAPAPTADLAAASDATDPADDADIALDLGDPLPPAAPAAPETTGADDADPVAELQAAMATEAAPEFPDVYPPPHGNLPASALARAVERRAAARAGGAAAGEPAAPPVHEPPALPTLAAPAPPGRWRRLVDALRRLFTGRQAGLPPLRAAFSADFAWPLRPAAVARWAQRHGRPEPLAPPDWPRRSIDIDRARLAGHRAKGFAHDLPLHVLTAAIGVGDRRIRVLIGADGSVIGPRAFDRSRSTGAALLLGAGLVALGWTLRPLHAPPADPGALLAAAPVVAASAPPVPASAASAPDEAASAAVAADAAASDAHAEPAEAHAANAASAPEAAASEPAGDIRPTLSDEQKYAAKVEAAKLRGEPPPPPLAPPEPAGPVYAVVGPGSATPDGAQRSLVAMRAAAARLDGGAPAHGELVNSQGQWRAAWWPFASLVDAERARVLLAGRGVKAEVVEF